MKRFLKNTTIAVAGFLTLGLAGAGIADAAEYPLANDPIGVMIYKVTQGEYKNAEYKNVMTAEKFIAALKGNYWNETVKVNPVAEMIEKVTEGEFKNAEYKNVMTAERFIAALGVRYDIGAEKASDAAAVGLAKAETVDPYKM